MPPQVIALQSLPWVVTFFVFLSALTRRDLLCFGYLIFGAVLLNNREVLSDCNGIF
jgi:hypothetical protein